MASIHDKLKSKSFYATRILPQVRGAVESGIPLEDLDIPEEYRSQAAADYESSGMSMPENAFREAKEMVTGLPEMAKVVGKGVAKAALPIDYFPEDPGLDELAREIAAGTVDEIGSVFTDPERMRVAPLATAGALLGPLAPGKFLKIKKPAYKGKLKEIGELGEAISDHEKRIKYDGGQTKDGLKYEQDIESGEPVNEMSSVEQEALDIVDPERLPSGKKWKESFEKGADELRPNRDRGAPYDKTFIDDTNSSVSDMDAAGPPSPETAGRYSSVRKPKSPDFDTDRRVPGQDPDDVLDIGETPNYPSKEIMDVENLSPSDAEAMSIYQELARENYAGGSSQKPGMFAASRKNNLPDPGAPKGPQGTVAEPTFWEKIKESLTRKEQPAPVKKPPVEEDIFDPEADAPAQAEEVTTEGVVVSGPMDPTLRDLRGGTPQAIISDPAVKGIQQKLWESIEADIAKQKASADPKATARQRIAKEMAEATKKPPRTPEQLSEDLRAGLDPEMIGDVIEEPMKKPAHPVRLKAEQEVDFLIKNRRSPTTPEERRTMVVQKIKEILQRKQ